MGIIRQSGWDLVHNRRKLRSDIMRRCHRLRLQDSEWYPECVKYYSTLDVKDRVVVDIGCDFGTSPMFFIERGAKFVWGFSLDDQYFHHDRYAHIKGIEYYPSTERHIDENELNEKVLKCDAEGWEWNLLAGFIDSFHDWVIALHYPVLNPFLYEWIKKNGVEVAEPVSYTSNDGDEFAVYRKR